MPFRLSSIRPSGLQNLSISESESRMEELESWIKRSRCLLLDRERRQFFVDTVSEVRGWLILREALSMGRKKYGRLRHLLREQAVHDLFAWLDQQTPKLLPDQFVTAWESKFQEKQAVRACVGAGFRLGFQADTIRALMTKALQNRKDDQDR